MMKMTDRKTILRSLAAAALCFIGVAGTNAQEFAIQGDIVSSIYLAGDVSDRGEYSADIRFQHQRFFAYGLGIDRL